MKQDHRFYVIFLSLSLITFSLNAQPWIKTLEEHQGNVVMDIIQYDDSKTVVLLNGTNPQLLFFQNEGEIINTIPLGNYFTQVYEMTITDSEFVIVGSKGDDFNNYSVITMLENDGTLIWTKEYERGFFASVAMKDEFILVGGNYDTAGSSSRQILMMYNKDGKLIWGKTEQFVSNSYIGKILVDGDHVFLVSSASTVGAGFDGFYVGEINLSTQEYIWAERYYTGRFYEVFDRNYDFPFGAYISGEEITIVFPGYLYGERSTFYKISKGGEFIDAIQLFSNEGLHPHDIKSFDNGDVLIVGSFQASSQTTNVVERRNQSGQLIWQKKFGAGTLLHASVNSNKVIIGGVKEPLYNASLPPIPFIASITEDGVLYKSGVSISLKKDDMNECGINAKINVDEDVKIFINKKELVKINDDKYILDLPIGQHTVTYKTPIYFDLCDWPSTIMIENEVNFKDIELITNINQCADLYIGITKTELIKGQSNKVFLEYHNKGNVDIEDAYVVLKIDNRLDFISASLDFEYIADNEVKLIIGTIIAGANGRISVTVQAQDEVSLFTNLTIETEIFPHTNCQEIDDYGDHFDIFSTCDAGKLTFQIVNRGENMLTPKKVAMLIDGYNYDSINIQLGAGMSQSFNLNVEGQVGTVQIYKDLNVIKSHTFEGCGTLPNGYSTVAIASQFNENLDLPFIDNSILELRNHHTDSRLFQSNNGKGRYHLVKSDFDQSQFVIRYVNDTDAPIENLIATVDLPSQSLPNSIEVLASSHEVLTEVKSGKLIITSKEPISPNTEFHCKFNLGFNPNIEPNEFLSLSLNLSNQNGRLGLKNVAYYNTELDFSLDTPSPFADIKDGHIFGKNDAVDFSSDLVILDNGDKIATGVVQENTVGSILTIYKFDKFEQLKWTKEYKFELESPHINDVELLNDGNIMLLGSLSDKNNSYNYSSDPISFFLVIDDNGEEVYQTKMVLEEEFFIGSSLSGALALDNGNILIIGYRYDSSSSHFRKLLLDSEYQKISIENIYPPSGIANIRYSGVVKNDNCIALVSFLDNLNQYDDSFIMFNKNGWVYNSYLFDFDSEDSSFSPYYSYIDQDGSVLCSGGYAEYENGEYVDSYYTIMELDNNQRFVRKFEILPDAYYSSIGPVMKYNGNYLAAGSFYPDSTSNGDAFLTEFDSSGNVLWMVGEDMGARESCQRILVGQDENVYATFQTQTTDIYYNLQMGYLYGPKPTLSTKDHGESSSIPSLLVYPNPTDGILCIEENGVKYIKHQIISMTGKTQKSDKISDRCLDVSDLSSGRYILIMTNENEIRKYINFIKI